MNRNPLDAQKKETPMQNTVLELSHVQKHFDQGKDKRRLEILKDCSLSLAPGEIVALVGPSGSGKSTLMQIAGLLENPSGGTVSINGKQVKTNSDSQRTNLRRTEIGFVYQYHHLLQEFSALENVMVPQMIAGVSKRKAQKRAKELLVSVGLGERLSHRPSRLSGGEQQRVALARALANTPSLLLGDEPTGNLDPKSSEQVFQLLLSLAKTQGLSALIATHNMELAQRMDRILSLDSGQLKNL